MSNHRAIKFDENPLLRPGLPIGRSRLMQWLLLFVLFLLIVRSFYLQFFHDEFLQRKGESLYKRMIDTPPMRGRISDRNGDMLALTTPVKSVWINPTEIRQATAGAESTQNVINADQLKRLAGLLGLSKSEIVARMKESGEFVYLKRQISPEAAEKIEAMNLPGVYTQREFRRYYPGGAVMAHVVGFVGIDGQGQEGVELRYQQWLEGKAGRRQVLRDRKGRIVEEIAEIDSPQDGRELSLSIDSAIQYFAYRRVKEAVETHRAKSGSVVVIDAQTGEVLAMANYPAFNPNNRGTFSTPRLRNRAVTDMFEPGSVVKPFTVAMAMDQKVIHAQTVIDLKPGFLQFGMRKIRDAHPADSMTVSEIIRKSSNIGTAKIAAMMSNSTIWKTLIALGFSHPTGVELPGEASGMLAKPQRWRPVDRAVISYGHGMSTSLIQLASAYTVFARDDGARVSPTMLLNRRPAISAPIFSRSTVMAVRQMLEATVNVGGTGALASVSGYRAGGKTGTALKIEKGRYTNKYYASFVGIAPMSAPRLVIAVTLDEPSAGLYYAGSVAAPVFADVMGNALRQLGIRPDAPQGFTNRQVDASSIVEGVQ